MATTIVTSGTDKHRLDSRKSRLAQCVALSCLFSYLAMSPIYVFPSGTPQPADIIAAIGLAACFLSSPSKVLSAHRSIIGPITWFVLYAFIISAVWAFCLDDLRMLMPPLFYAYNLSIFVLILWLESRDRERLLYTLRFGIATAVVMSLGILIFGVGGARSIRSTGGFNNPNQLGYFSLLVISLSTCLFLGTKRQGALTSVTIAAAVPQLFASVSFAAIGGASVTILAWLLSAPTMLRRMVFPILIGGIGLAGILFASPTVTERIVKSIEIRSGRLQHKHETMAEERNYSRIVEFPEYMVFGSAEGAYWRFGKHNELHSSLGTIVFCYGIPGTITIALFFARLIRGSHLWVKCVLLSPLLFSLTHQSLRVTLLWILLAAIVILKHTRANDALSKTNRQGKQMAAPQFTHNTTV